MEPSERDRAALLVIRRVRALATLCLVLGTGFALLLALTLPDSLVPVALVPLLGGFLVSSGGFLTAAGLREQLATAQALRSARAASGTTPPPAPESSGAGATPTPPEQAPAEDNPYPG